MLLYYCIHQTHCEKEIKCSASLTFYFCFPTHLINSIKHEHSCKILYIQNSEGAESHMLRYKWVLYTLTLYLTEVPFEASANRADPDQVALRAA